MSTGGPIVLFAGGTGGAKLARGLLDHVGDELVVIANTGDDLEIYGTHVSPDPDLVTFWLADRIDARGWGLDGDTFHVMDGLRELGDEVWFNLGDRDLAVCARRARRLSEGASLTEALAETVAAFGVAARVLPPSDDPVRTEIRAHDRWWRFQEFMIGVLATDPTTAVQDVAFRGAERARISDATARALHDARAIVIGPSNPVVSIGPMLAIPGLREALRDAAAPVVAVAPFVCGDVLKGPTRTFLAWAGIPADAAGVARIYDGLIDGLLTDEDSTPPLPGPVTVRRASTLLGDPAGRREVAGSVLALCEDLRATTGAPA